MAKFTPVSLRRVIAGGESPAELATARSPRRGRFMRGHLRTLGMIVLVLLCGTVAVVMNRGIPTWAQNPATKTAKQVEPSPKAAEAGLKSKIKPPKGMRLVWHDE